MMLYSKDPRQTTVDTFLVDYLFSAICPSVHLKLHIKTVNYFYMTHDCI